MRQLLNFTFAIIMLAFITRLAQADQAWLQFGGPSQVFEFNTSIPLTTKPPTKRWQRTLGAGMAGVVRQGNLAYTSFLVPSDASDAQVPEAERGYREAVVALDAENGKTVWRHEYESGWKESQQAFGGRSRAPHATPAISGDSLMCIGFTGIMHCLDRKTGDVIWMKDLVEEYQAIPVQFGFSASPVPFGNQVIVLAGGKAGGLVCMDLKTGKTIWNVPCKEASYATPALWPRSDGNQVVFKTRNRVIGVDTTNGKRLWDYRLPEQGLTNVPTPLPLDETGLLVSGQGIKGTRRLNIAKSPTGYEVSETWSSDSQFFYCNWVRRDGVLWGCNGSLLTALDLETGKTIGRFRGYKDANLLVADDRMYILDGEGNLSKVSMRKDELKVIAKYSVIAERCWTPPTPSGHYLYCRGGDQLLCVDLFGGDPRAAVVSMRVRKPVLTFDSTDDGKKKLEAMQAILTTFEKNGAAAALETYEKCRDQDPDSIPYEQRKQLAKRAQDGGLKDFANLILQHAAEDFPEETKQANLSPSSKTDRRENGLLYLEFAIRNTAEQTIQAVVKGPDKHPFSYGLPLRPGVSRLETWPVGTKLYRTHQGIRKELLLTVKEDFAGTTVEVPIAASSSE